ncbi:hypothetical protein DPEC_G00331350 [Dallia pectoralis]|uniref:Uncharacterized protein n=1 Tax=Dallia pectoralis TaxID=75939 RepID=A0ACC2F956_DALPE|nr:hypothetical protein DPEC_G00331350 [Dallia pectoralis]
MIAVQCLSYTITNIRKQHNKAAFFNTFYFATTIRPLGLCTLDHRTPYSWDPPVHYKHLKKVITTQQLHTHRSQDWSFKTLRKLITDRDTITAIPSLTTEQCTTVWENTASPTLTNKHTDIAWMAAIRCLPTRLTGSAAMTLQSILFGPLQGLRSHQDRNAWRVINATKQTIWEIRNVNVFHKQDTLPIITARILQKCIKDYISLDTHRLGKDTANINWNITTLEGTFITPPITNLHNPTSTKTPLSSIPPTNSQAGIRSRHLALDPSYSRANYWTFKPP